MTNLELMRKRLEWQGGIHQEDRMIKDKWRTLQRALKYSYQACTVQMVQPRMAVLDSTSVQIDPEMSVYPMFRALINPDKVKQDYDDKVLSIDYESGYQPGDVFEWSKTGTQWLIYLREITEDAYFRGKIRRCKHIINFKDAEGNWCSTYAAIRGPVETEINSIQKNQVRVDVPNFSLNILMPLNDKTRAAFDRYSEFLFDNKCSRVEATDTISMENVLEVNAGEYFIDRDTDDVESEMKNGLVIEPINPSPNSTIVGETFIKPMIAEEYIAPEKGGEWFILEDCPAKICHVVNNVVTVIWNKSTSGQFTLQWRNGAKTEEKVIVVESLF